MNTLKETIVLYTTLIAVVVIFGGGLITYALQYNATKKYCRNHYVNQDDREMCMYSVHYTKVKGEQP